MKRFVVAVVLCALPAPPAGAQEGRSEAVERTSVPAAGSRLNLQAIVHEKALALASLQVPQVPQAPAPPAATPTAGIERSTKEKTIYILTVAGAVAGTIFNIKTTRDALDHHLEARTFPLVWKTTTDPKDKGSVSAIIAGTNSVLMAASAVVFVRGNTALASFVNLMVAGSTTVVSLHDRSVINNCESKRTCR